MYELSFHFQLDKCLRIAKMKALQPTILIRLMPCIIGVYVTIFNPQIINGQILMMDFEVNASTCVSGPSPLTMSASAGVLNGGANGKALAAKTATPQEKLDINMDFGNASGIWDVVGLEVSVDFQREEAEGWFFTRLNNDFRFGMSGGYLQVRYQVEDGNGGSTTINSGNIQLIPDDDTWRTYRFTYDYLSGVGTVYINDNIVWDYDGSDGRELYWENAGGLRVGDMMDATGSVEPIMDNVTYASFSTLPISLGSFHAERKNNCVHLNWTTHAEHNSDYFIIQRSDAGQQWNNFEYVPAAGNSESTLKYGIDDCDEAEASVCYRLLQTDFDGISRPSEIRCLDPQFDMQKLNQPELQVLKSHSGFELTLNGAQIKECRVYCLAGRLLDIQTVNGIKLEIEQYNEPIIVSLTSHQGQLINKVIF